MLLLLLLLFLLLLLSAAHGLSTLAKCATLRSV
jgi:hypothetical protein